MTAIAERPNGRRVNFACYPTPLLDEGGEFVGAVNLLIDIIDAREEAYLRDQASRCRRLAYSTTDVQAAEALQQLAIKYENKASEIRSRDQPAFSTP